MSKPAKYCRYCAHGLVSTIPAGDTVHRQLCRNCGNIEYETPTATVSTLMIAQKKILFICRDIPPYAGKWAPPGGYPEKGESMRQAAIRELREETGLEIDQDQLIPFFLSSISPMNQYYIAFRAHLPEPIAPKCGPEVRDAAWFDRHQFPADKYWLPALTSILSDVYDCVDSDYYPLHVADVTKDHFESNAFEIGVRK